MDPRTGLPELQAQVVQLLPGGGAGGDVHVGGRLAARPFQPWRSCREGGWALPGWPWAEAGKEPPSLCTPTRPPASTPGGPGPLRAAVPPLPAWDAPPPSLSQAPVSPCHHCASGKGVPTSACWDGLTAAQLPVGPLGSSDHTPLSSAPCHPPSALTPHPSIPSSSSGPQRPAHPQLPISLPAPGFRGRRPGGSPQRLPP